ncbi:hypothetical protein AMATHDRAFT_75180 [Amanita thiersii Skay4041]|uniref:Uncharacterized protein n=1 Tax=Amanita thiersii Skay4041 TaxID=703135 RepID=A0A2A9NKJ7_9AGAR|nr:hypothetical protein AMATHDRAFT_75180 [Amanita thiersii Skay4041]
MSSAATTATSPNSYYFRRRTIGRAASPPTWACYEQIPFTDDDDDDDDDDEDGFTDSCSDSCSEDDDDDDDDYPRSPATLHDDPVSNDMDIDDEAGDSKKQSDNRGTASDAKKDVKGKQKAADPDPEDRRRRNRKRHNRPMYTLRPILTIHKSQGFVWNQDLFVPPYIKDRYIASTSPPNSRGFVSSSALSTSSGLTDYEVEVVEIRVAEGDLDRIIP